MGIPAKSRKGKKAWRKNIDVQQVEDFLTEESHKQVRAPPVQSLKDEELFVLDKDADDAAVPAAVRKRSAAQQKPLRSQLILQSMKDGIKPLHVPTKHKAKGPARPLPGSMPAAAVAATEASAAAAAAAAAAKGNRKPARRRGLKVGDIWAESGPDRMADWTAPTSGADLILVGKRKQQQQQQQGLAAAADVAGGARSSSGSKKRRLAAAAAAAAAPSILAVEVDMPGCSFNPEHEAHQDALAAAVAQEYRKQLAAQLAPKAPSPHAPDDYVRPADELEALLVDAEPDDDEAGSDEGGAAAKAAAAAAAAQDENAIPLDDSSSDDDEGQQQGEGVQAAAPAAAAAAGQGRRAAAAAGGSSQRKTRKDRNREVRRKEQETALAAKEAMKQQRRQLEQLAELQQQLQEEDAEKEAARTRRQIVAAERAANEPPRLGKARFEAPPVAVLTSDEVTGSLRQLQPCFTLAAERFKALQKRGLVEPRKPRGRSTGKRIEYVTGDRRERAEEAQQEIEGMKKARRSAAKAGAAGAGAAAAGVAVAGSGSGKGSKGKRGKAAAVDAAAAAAGSMMPLDVGADGGLW